MAPTTLDVPDADLAELVAERFSSEQLHALAARVAAAELREPDPPPPPFDLAAAVALDLDAALTHLVGRYTATVGVDTDILSAWLLPQLVRAGASEPDALAALERHTGWRPRSAEERLESVVRAMRADGFTPEQIRSALREVSQ